MRISDWSSDVCSSDLKGCGNEDRGENRGDRDDRAGDLRHRFTRGLARRFAKPDMTLDILDNDNRVIDDDADREQQTEQRDVVELTNDNINERQHTNTHTNRQTTMRGKNWQNKEKN